MGDTAKSVAESVVIYLHGFEKCDIVDRLLAMGVVGNYCVPLMQCTLEVREFRGMYPFLVYSARLFRVLAQTKGYAEALMDDCRVLPLLLQVFREQSSTF